jgi:hypothetical protein
MHQATQFKDTYLKIRWKGKPTRQLMAIGRQSGVDEFRKFSAKGLKCAIACVAFLDIDYQ